MRPFTSMAFIVTVCAVPITPSAPALQRRAEQFRLEGLKEHEIAAKLSLPDTEVTDESRPFFAGLSTKVQSLFHHCDEEEEDGYLSGDIAPGSLESPQMLPRAAILEDNFLEKIVALLRRDDPERKRFAYEGKGLELRRPTGMRHWGSQDKWKLF